MARFDLYGNPDSYGVVFETPNGEKLLLLDNCEDAERYAFDKSQDSANFIAMHYTANKHETKFKCLEYVARIYKRSELSGTIKTIKPNDKNGFTIQDYTL